MAAWGGPCQGQAGDGEDGVGLGGRMVVEGGGGGR
jgi:hypothetical protein